MLVKELKEKLKSYGLSTAGVKQELEARLENYENELNAKDPSRLATVAANTTSGGGDEQDENETTELNNSTDESKHLENVITMATSNETLQEPQINMDTNSMQETTNTNVQEIPNTNDTHTNVEQEAETTTTTEPQMTDEEKAEQVQREAEQAQQAQQELEKRQAEEQLQREQAEAERLEKIKLFVEQQSDLYKQIFTHTKETLNVNVCQKVEECISSNKLTMDDLDNQVLLNLLQSVDERSTEAFDKFLTAQPEPEPAVAVVASTTEPTVKTEGDEAPAVIATTETTMETSTELNDETSAPTIATTTAIIVEATEVKVEEKIPKSNVEQLIEILTEWKKANLSEEEKRQNNRRNRDRNQKKAPRPGPNEEKLKEILARTGYSHEVSSGQRKYGGPPPNWPTSNSNGDVTKKEETITDEKPNEVVANDEIKAEVTSNGDENGHKEEATEASAANSQTNGTTNNPTPATPTVLHPGVGCECFVGKLPRDLFEDELIPVFEQQGKIWDLRLMIDPSTGFSKGYCFVTYCDKESAALAAKNLNDHEIRPGKSIRVNVSVANIRLFIGNIPKSKSKEELKAEFSKIVEGLSELIIFNGGEPATPVDDKIKNRGFCFLEFVDHKSASVAKRKLSKFNRVLNREIAVDWADPHEEPDEETMSKVKVLYVKNISAEVTEEEVQKLFETYGKLERVRKMKDYAFIHFEQREECMKAMEEQQGKILGKNALEISLARPLTEKKKQAQQKRNDNDHQFNRNRNNNNYSNNNNYNNNWNNNNQMMGQNGRGFNNNRNGGGMNGGGNRGYGGNNRNNNNNQRSNYNNNNNFNGNMNRGGYGGQNNNNFNRGNGNFGGNRGNFGGNNNGKMNNKRKNGGNMGGNGGGDNKKFRFNQNNNNNGMDAGNWNNNGQNQQQISFDNNQQMNGAGGGDQGNNVWYQDNFNTSSQWI